MQKPKIMNVLTDCAKGLVDADVVKSLWQVGIVKYDFTNEVASHLLLFDYIYSPYTYPAINTVKSRFEKIRNDFKDTAMVKNKHLDFFTIPTKKPGNIVQCICNSLKKIEFECCVTEVIYNDCQDGKRTGYRSLGPETLQYTKKEYAEKRNNPDEWSFGCQLEAVIYIYNKIYLTSFFNFEGNVLAVAAFLENNEKVDLAEDIIERVIDEKSLCFDHHKNNQDIISINKVHLLLTEYRKSHPDQAIEEVYEIFKKKKDFEKLEKDEEHLIEIILKNYKTNNSIQKEKIIELAKRHKT